jgi:hypothetical protein
MRHKILSEDGTASKRILAVNLRKKYPNPHRACDAKGGDVEGDYCVGGALCIEVGGPTAMHYPDYKRLLQAVIKANPNITTPWMDDAEYNAFRSKLIEVEARNDIGDFAGAWRALEELLNWPATPMPNVDDESMDEE